MGSISSGTITNLLDALDLNYYVYGVRLLVSIIAIVARWMLFAKFNESGWKAIIPFYNYYEYGKISGKKGWALTGCIAQALLGIAFPLIIVITALSLSTFNYGLDGLLAGVIIGLLVLLVLVVLSIASTIIVMIAFSKFYEQRDLVAVLMIIVKPLAEIILGFTSAFKFKAVQPNYYYNDPNRNPYQTPVQNPYQAPVQNQYQNMYQNMNPNTNQNTYQNPYQDPNQNMFPDGNQNQSQNVFQNGNQNQSQNVFPDGNQNQNQDPNQNQ